MARFAGAKSISSAQYWNKEEAEYDGESFTEEVGKVAQIAKQKGGELKGKIKDFWSELTNRY